MSRIASIAELYAHAIAIEREAAARYAELAERMEDLGNTAAAEVFARLAGFEAEHLETLRARTAGVAVPALAPQEYAWLDAGPPETAARELIFRLMTPRQAFAIALRAEQRAQAFFERLLMTASDPALRALSREMAADEAGHVAMLEQLLQATPEPLAGWVVVDDR